MGRGWYRWRAYADCASAIAKPRRHAITFDQAKSASSRLKHGIDFIEAQAIWRGDTHVLVAARAGTEQRFIVVGRIDDKHWSAVVTYRGDLVRIILVRRSRDSEVQAYGSQRIRQEVR